MLIKRLLTLACIVVTCCDVNGQTVSRFIDHRDGQSYPTVTLTFTGEGNTTIRKEWFARNLSFESEKSFCYKSEPAYCEVFGRLYLWEVSSNVCPDGWHLPSSEEWQSLINNYGGLKTAGAALNENGETGLDLQMGGFGDVSGQYLGIGASGYYWSVKGGSPELLTIDASTDEILYDPIGNANKNSVRCVKD